MSVKIISLIFTPQIFVSGVLNFFSSSFSTHLSEMDLPTLISRTIPFPNLGVLGGIFFICIQILMEHSVSKQ